MREPLRDKERLEHMLAAAHRVIRYTSNKSFEDLKADDMMYYAVVKNIEIIGEAANMLSSDFVDNHSETPWKQVRGDAQLYRTRVFSDRRCGCLGSRNYRYPSPLPANPGLSQRVQIDKRITTGEITIYFQGSGAILGLF